MIAGSCAPELVFSQWGCEAKISEATEERFERVHVSKYTRVAADLQDVSDGARTKWSETSTDCVSRAVSEVGARLQPGFDKDDAYTSAPTTALPSPVTVSRSPHDGAISTRTLSDSAEFETARTAGSVSSARAGNRGSRKGSSLSSLQFNVDLSGFSGFLGLSVLPDDSAADDQEALIVSSVAPESVVLQWNNLVNHRDFMILPGTAVWMVDHCKGVEGMLAALELSQQQHLLPVLLVSNPGDARRRISIAQSVYDDARSETTALEHDGKAIELAKRGRGADASRACCVIPEGLLKL